MGRPKWVTPAVIQSWCVSGVLVCIVGQGVALGHTACMLPALLAPDSPIKMDIQMASWLASGPAVAVLLGIAAACYVMDRRGRRVAYCISIIPGIVGWTLTYLAQSYSVLFIARIFIAVTGGAITTVGVVMIGECTSPHLRGMFFNLKTTGISFGSAVAHFLGNFMDWRTMAMVALVPHIIAILITFACPESPSWLASKKQYDKCEKEFFWLRGVTEKSTREVTELIESQKERFSQPKKETKLGVKEFLKKFTMKDFLMPMFINIVALILMEACGRHYFPIYALQIMSDVVQSKTYVHYYTLCIDIIVVACTMISAILLKLIKMRTLLFVSGIGSLIILVFMCTFLYLTSLGVISNYPWIVTLFFVLFFAFGHLGCAPVPLVLQGELFPLAHRETGISLIGGLVSFLFIAFLKITPYMLLSLKVYGTLAVYGVIMAICLLILYFTLPETKDKTLQEIENYFRYGKYRVDKNPDKACSRMLTEEDESPHVAIKD